MLFSSWAFTETSGTICFENTCEQRFQFYNNPDKLYLFKVNHRNRGKGLKYVQSQQYDFNDVVFGVFIVNFKYISHFFLFLLLNK